MLISLAIALTFTPWLSRRLLAHGHAGHAAQDHADTRLHRLFERRDVAVPARRAARARTGTSCTSARWPRSCSRCSLAVVQWVVLKMLPFDNKSEFQVVLDMPEGTPVEETARVLDELAAEVARRPEVTDYQVYAGTSAPINFNGLVRQYYLRSGPEVGDIQVNLVDKHHRDQKSHEIALEVRPALARIGKQARRLGQGRRSAAGAAGAGAAGGRSLRAVPGQPAGADAQAAPGVRRDAGRRRRRRQPRGPEPAPGRRDRPAEGRAARREPGRRGADAGGRARRARRDLRAGRARVLPDSGPARTRCPGQGRPRQRAGAAGALALGRARAAVRDRRGRTATVGQRDLPQGPAAAGVGHRRLRRQHRQPALRHVRDGRHAARRGCRRSGSSSSTSPTTRTGRA